VNYIKGNPTIVFTKPQEVVLEDREIPSPKEGEVLIKTIRSLISIGTELTILSGKFPPDSAWANYGKFPFLPGYSNVGRVVDVGKGVGREWIGKKVASYAPHSAFVLSSIEHLRVIDREVSDEEVAFFCLSEICLNGVRRGDVRLGESVGIYGLGLLGQLTARFCWLAGARPVIGIDIAKERLERFPKKAGFFSLNPEEEAVREKVSELTKGRMVDVVFEVTGNPHLIPREFEILRRQGRFVVLSSPWGPTPSFDFHDLCNSPSYTIIGAHNSSHPQYPTLDNPWTQKRHFELFLDLLYNGDLDVKSLITHRISYEEAPEFYLSLLQDRSKALGVVIEWE
jgi:2-desacetyl-2-hydroxyethyl bacteriochlorophyllide A dehydrogenase